jgi:hypothetical protein
VSSVRPRCLSELDGEPGAHHAFPATIAGPGMGNMYEATVPALSWMAS